MSLGDTAFSLWNAGFDACGYPKSLNRIEKESSMSNEADWADEIAVRLFDEYMGSDVIVEPIAKALREARAEGMRLASEIKAASRQDRRQVSAIDHINKDPRDNTPSNLRLRTMGTLGENSEQIKAK